MYRPWCVAEGLICLHVAAPIEVPQYRLHWPMVVGSEEQGSISEPPLLWLCFVLKHDISQSSINRFCYEQYSRNAHMKLWYFMRREDVYPYISVTKKVMAVGVTAFGPAWPPLVSFSSEGESQMNGFHKNAPTPCRLGIIKVYWNLSMRK